MINEKAISIQTGLRRTGKTTLMKMAINAIFGNLYLLSGCCRYNGERGEAETHFLYFGIC